MSAYSASTHLPADPATERDPRSNRATIARLVCTAGLALLMLVNVGAWNAGLWFASVSLAELIFSRTRALASGPERTALQRTLHSAGVLLENAFYSWPTALLWLTGEARLQIVATCVICVQLFNASTFAYRDRTSLLVCGGPPALTMVLLTLFAGHMPLFDRLTVVLGFGLAAFYAINASRVNVGMLEKLRTTQLDLEEQTRSAMSANAAKSDFLALMSHELRTPMNGMLGMAHALRGTPLNQAQSEYLDMMVLSGGNLMAILNDILDFSKIETGKLELNAEPFDLRDAATQVFQIWSEIGAAKGVALRLDIPADAPRWLHGDVLRVRQIMLNLVSNAVKFTPEGKVTLSLATGAAGEVLIFVSDTGSGIDAENQIRLFAPFTQGSASIARRRTWSVDLPQARAADGWGNLARKRAWRRIHVPGHPAAATLRAGADPRGCVGSIGTGGRARTGGRGQSGQSGGRRGDSRRRGTSRRRRLRRLGGARTAARGRLRPRVDGRAHAADGRRRGHRPHPSRGSRTPVNSDHRADRRRHDRRARAADVARF